MAIVILDPRMCRLYKGVEILWLRDPNRYRATLWDVEHPAFHIATFWSKDAERLQKRVFKYIDKLAARKG